MSPVPAAAIARPIARWGLAAKLFAILLLLGAVAVLVTGVLGYVRARDALEQAIFNQLTAARETKSRQVETYFRTIRNELRLLATSKMVVDATRGFRDAVDELDAGRVPPELRQKVGDWYADDYMPEVRRATRHGPGRRRLPAGRRRRPTTCSTTTSSTIPIRKERRKLLDDAGDGSDYSRLHAIYHPLMRAAAPRLGFFDFMLADPKSGRI